MITGLPMVRRAEVLQVGFQPPGQRALIADDAVFADGGDQHDGLAGFHDAAPWRAKAASASPLSRQMRHSSITCAPIDL